MGNWGYKLYQDDDALDVKEEFIQLLKKGLDCESATKELIRSNIPLVKDEDTAPIFWFVLADVQWKYGILLDDVKKMAIFHIENGSDIARWRAEEPKLAEKREGELQQLKEKLLSPQPPAKKIKVERQYRCEWKLGDTYAYPLLSDCAKENGLYGEYFIFYKVGERVYHPSHIIPIVLVKLTENGRLPKTKDEFDALNFVKHASYRETLVIDQTISQKDEDGFYPFYRISLINTSKRIIPKTLIFLGNFQEIRLPAVEAFPSHPVGYTSFLWKNFDEQMIKCYRLHTLKQSPIYEKG